MALAGTIPELLAQVAARRPAVPDGRATPRRMAGA
jgi:hypothetical protein